MAQPTKISITPLLRRLWPNPAEANVTASEIALAISHIFTDQLSSVQTGALLTALHFTGWDRKADVIAECAQAMRDAAWCVDVDSLRDVVKRLGRREGSYGGGLVSGLNCSATLSARVEIHSTFNISTTSSILASSLLLLSKHGNRAATSKSGSTNLLTSTTPTPPNLNAITPKTISKVYESTNYAFLYAPVFHPRWTNPVETVFEARVVGVARRDLGPVFAEALKMAGLKKAMVICGEEDLDEVSCAGRTFCWRLVPRPNPDYRGSNGEDSDTSDNERPPRELVGVEHFMLSPSDFGLLAHQLSEVSPGKMPHENAKILMKLLSNQLPSDNDEL
ncbi:MAG: anthranilate phosphoribosyltransferase [Geoglossum umbratile]|nr:MAG: anthranilate phosphoribosyltransferase [Geoglossum umbratile]